MSACSAHQPLREVVLHPRGEFGGGRGVSGDEVFKSGLSGREIGAVEDGSDVGSDLGAQINTRDVSLSILLKVELAALPGNGRKDGGAGAPGLEFDIELGGAGADLGGTHGVAAEVLDDLGDRACGHSLDIHLGEGEHEGLLTADALFEGTGIKVHAIADLRDAEFDGAAAGGEGLWLESVGAAQAGITTFVGPGVEDGGAFLNHGLVDEKAEALGKAGGAFIGEKLQNGGQEIRINLVGHVCVFVGCVWIHPNRDHTGPLYVSLKRKPHPGPAAFGSLRSPSLRRPRMGRSGVKSNYRRTFTPPADRAHAEKHLKDFVKTSIESQPKLAPWAEDSHPESLTVFALPEARRKRLRTSNACENVNGQIKKRSRVVGLFPSEESLLRLVTGVLVEISETLETGKTSLTLN